MNLERHCLNNELLIANLGIGTRNFWPFAGNCLPFLHSCLPWEVVYPKDGSTDLQLLATLISGSQFAKPKGVDGVRR